jgi:hypothetical protein
VKLAVRGPVDVTEPPPLVTTQVTLWVTEAPTELTIAERRWEFVVPLPTEATAGVTERAIAPTSTTVEAETDGSAVFVAVIVIGNSPFELDAIELGAERTPEALIRPAGDEDQVTAMDAPVAPVAVKVSVAPTRMFVWGTVMLTTGVRVGEDPPPPPPQPAANRTQIAKTPSCLI